MGNCIRKQASEQCSGEKASVFRDISGNPPKGTGLEMSSLLGEVKGADRVVVKVSKKQLQQLMKQAEVEGLSSQDIISRLMTVGDRFEAHHRSWIPSLERIPE